MNRPLQYVAKLEHVRDVTITGRANLDYWTDRLKSEDLVPIARDEHAQVLMIAAQGRFMNLDFREFSISVMARWQYQETTFDGAFLVQAFNSRRFFAWVERTVFEAPYDYADVTLNEEIPASISVAQSGRTQFRIKMKENVNKVAESSAEEVWSGPIFLPHRRADSQSHHQLNRYKWFYAEVRGVTSTYSFVDGFDEFHIQPEVFGELNSLVNSGFHPEQWKIRVDARHAKSKTYGREALPRICP